MNKAELRKQFADENGICISDCKFIPGTHPYDYAEWLEEKILLRSIPEMSQEELSDEHEQALKRGSQDYADGYIEGLSDASIILKNRMKRDE